MAYEIRDHEGTRLIHDKAFVNNLDLAYCIGGPESAPKVMLVHGVPKSMFFWRKVIPLLTPRYRVCVVDLRGFGDSERPVTGYDSNLIASDLIGIADEVGFDKFRVVGEDWGAAYAYTLAATYRDRVEQLVFQEMILPGLGYDGYLTRGGTGDKPLKRWDTRTLWHLIFFSVPDFPEMLLAGREKQFWGQWMKSEMRDPSALTEADLNEYTRWLGQPGGTRTIMEVYRDAEKDGVQNKELFEKKLEIPVLAVGGDFFFGEVPRKQMEQVAVNVRGVVIRSGHNIALEKPEELAKAYLDFFDELNRAEMELASVSDAMTNQINLV